MSFHDESQMYDCIKMMIDKGLYLNEIRDGKLLFEACSSGYLTIVKLLLENGANPNPKLENEWSPLRLACFGGNKDIAELLLLHGADINDDVDQETLLFVAIGNGHFGLVELLIEHGADVYTCNHFGASQLEVACEKGRSDMVQLLIDNGVNINKEDRHCWTALHTVCAKGYLDIMKILIKNGANVNQKDSTDHTPLHTAAYRGSLPFVRYLVENGANIHDVTVDGFTPLGRAIQSFVPREEVVRYLIEKGSDVNRASNFGSPLRIACSYSAQHIGIVKLLLENDADPNLLDITGTPLSVCCKFGLVEMAELLLKHGADVNKADNHLKTPLHMAVKRLYYDRMIDFLLLLISYNADVNRMDHFKRTPLYLAVNKGHLHVVKLLVQNDANFGDVKIDILTKHHRDTCVTNNCDGCFTADLVELVFVHGWTMKEHQNFPIIKRKKIETFFKLYSVSWLSKIPKQFVYTIFKRFSLMQ
jgi:ankyrin repeat protein